MIAIESKELIEVLKSEVPLLVERLDKIHKDWANWYGWYFRGDTKREKMLPYHNWQTFRRLQKTGQLLYYHSTTVRSIHEKLESYIVGKGHKYTVAARANKTPNQSLLDQITEIIKDITEKHSWQAMQNESVRRFFREGEIWRKPKVKDDLSIKVQFLEPIQIQQPSGEERGEFGVMADEEDPSEEISYWVHTSPENISDIDPKWFAELTVQEDRIQHIKGGVDANDPRGIPLFWSVYRDAREIDEVGNACTRLGVTQSEHAAVYQYQQTTAARKISAIAKAIAQGQQYAQETELGLRSPDERLEPTEAAAEPGAVHHAKNYEVNIPGASFPASEFVGLIQYKKRDIASLADMPEFMVTGDAETGNRSSLVSAEGPFDRRVKREQGWLIEADVEILWFAVQIALQMDDGALMELRKEVSIRAEGPEAAGRDPQIVSTMMIEQVAAGLQSKRGAIQVFERDPDKVLQEITEEREEEVELNKEIFGNELTFMPDGTALPPPEPKQEPEQRRAA